MHSSQFVEIGYSNLDNFHFETAYWVILMKSQRGSKALGKKCLTEIQAVKKGGKPFVLVQLWGRGVAHNWLHWDKNRAVCGQQRKGSQLEETGLAWVQLQSCKQGA